MPASASCRGSHGAIVSFPYDVHRVSIPQVWRPRRHPSDSGRGSLNQKTAWFRRLLFPWAMHPPGVSLVSFPYDAHRIPIPQAWRSERGTAGDRTAGMPNRTGGCRHAYRIRAAPTPSCDRSMPCGPPSHHTPWERHMTAQSRDRHGIGCRGTGIGDQSQTLRSHLR